MQTENLPPPAKVIFTDKSKKEYYVYIKENKGNYTLEVSESPQQNKRSKYSFPIKRALSEIDQNDFTVLKLITTEKEILLKFENYQEASRFHEIICKKSEVFAENKAIAHVDDEMRAIWPFSGGSYF